MKEKRQATIYSQCVVKQFKLADSTGGRGVILVASATRFMREFVNLLLGAKNVANRGIMRRIVNNMHR